jgi:predicted permease
VLSAVMVVAGAVLVIAAMNLAGLLMARGVSRARELAVQRALGAGLLRLVRQLIAQSVLVALAGGGVGLVVATLVLGLYRAYAPAKFVVPVPIDVPVLIFTLAVCVGSGLLVGLAPAVQTLKLDVLSALGGGTGATARTRARVRHWIVVPQIGLTVMLLVVGGLHVRALLTLELSDPGYRVNDVVVLRLGIADWVRRSSLTAPPSLTMGERAQVFYRELIDRLASIPRVSVGLTEELPVAVHDRTTRLLTRDRADQGRAPVTVQYPMNVSPGFFSAQGIEILAGRDFKASDSMTSTPVAVVSDSLARRLWPGENPIGKAFRINVSSLPGPPIRWLEVIGVVHDVDSALHDSRDRAVAYQSFGQFELPLVQNLVVRGHGETLKAVSERVSQAIAPTVSVVGIRPLSEIVSEILYSRRMAVAILLTSGLVGLFLASIGLYGVVSFSVAERQRELGIRSTLGAARRDMMMIVLREGFTVAGMGAVAGAAASASLMRVAASLVGPVPTMDLLTFVVVAAFIAAVILLASAGPARRASRVDPLSVLRSS